MPDGPGFQTRIGIGLESTWKTGVAPTELISFKSEGMKKEIARIQNAILDGKASRLADDAGINNYGGPIPCELTYQDLDMMFALFFGANATVSDDGTYYTRRFTYVDKLAKSGTIVIDKIVTGWNWLGSKISKFELSGSASDGTIDVTFDVLSGLLQKSTNYQATVQGLSLSGAPKLTFDDLTFRIGDQADDLAAGDDIKPTSISISADRKPSPDHVNDRDPLEASEEDRPEFTMKFGLPKYEDDTFPDFGDADTKLQATIDFVSGSYQYLFEFPELKITSPPPINISGAGKIPVEVELMGFRNSSTVIMTSITDPVRVTTINKRSALPLG